MKREVTQIGLLSKQGELFMRNKTMDAEQVNIQKYSINFASHL